MSEEKKLNEQSPLAVLVRAKAYLIDHGWQRGYYGANGGPRCLVGAMWSVSGGSDLVPQDAYFALYDAIGAAPEEWNDKPKLKIKHVLAAIDKAIDIVVREGAVKR